MTRILLLGAITVLLLATAGAAYALRPSVDVDEDSRASDLVASLPTAADTLPEWAAFELAELSSERSQSGRPYLPFLDEESMSMGLYELAVGAVDGQQPHARDEVYVVMSGRAVLSVAGEDTPVGPGSVVFVAARVDHRFHSIDEPLSVLVLFAGDTD